MERTEEVVDSLTERTKLLDINQKRILLLLKENQKRISKLDWKDSTSRQRNIIHSQINSLLIHVNDHMDYLGYLLNSKEHNGAYTLALNDYERGKVIQSLTNESQVWKGTKDQILDYRFEMLGPHDLCLILNVPLIPPLQSIAAVRPFVFPTIEHKKTNLAESPTRPLFTVSWKFLCKIRLANLHELHQQRILQGAILSRNSRRPNKLCYGSIFQQCKCIMPTPGN